MSARVAGCTARLGREAVSWVGIGRVEIEEVDSTPRHCWVGGHEWLVAEVAGVKRCPAVAELKQENDSAGAVIGLYQGDTVTARQVPARCGVYVSEWGGSGARGSRGAVCSR